MTLYHAFFHISNLFDILFVCNKKSYDVNGTVGVKVEMGVRVNEGMKKSPMGIKERRRRN